MLAEFYLWLDPFMVAPFRALANPYAGLTLGLAWVALVCTVIGELTMAGAYFLNKDHFRAMRRDMITHNNLSIRALGFKDKTSYTACNAVANDAFGRNFFGGIALFASSLWPAFFAMGWIDFRFREVAFDLPVLGQAGVAFFFVPMYIAVRVAFGLAKPWIPVFSAIQAKVRANEDGEEMMTYMDIVKDEGEPAEARPEGTGA